MLSDTTEIWTYLLDGLILVPGRDKKKLADSLGLVEWPFGLHVHVISN